MSPVGWEKATGDTGTSLILAWFATCELRGIRILAAASAALRKKARHAVRSNDHDRGGNSRFSIAQ